ncbi:HNH endonuclease signature motif containing protein, partial [Mycobacterium sp. E740]|uniref:HNH endonuclease signature motif containing protein n=1 Tax=Mycobacterium sp. E740 TaxID=1834149 RepID=UPI000A4763D1
IGVLPAALVREMAATATLKPVHIPTDTLAQRGYRPSTALAEFIRCRDLSCRWPGCDKPAWKTDIDHTVAYPLGPTHPSNTACYCRFHHLMKTFHCGPGGWSEQQSPDGTIVFTSPSGRIYTTEPLGAQLFPQLGVPTGELATSTGAPPSPWRGLAMPKRKHTRAQQRAYRIHHERAINTTRYTNDPPPF